MKFSTRFISLFLAVLMCLSLLPIGAMAEETTTETERTESIASATDTDTPAVTATPVPTATPTVTPEPTAVPTTEPIPVPTAAATETPAPTTEPTATPEPTATATPSPTATPEDGIIASGTCGDNLTWTLDDDGLLTISGTGDMEDWVYSNGQSNRPWYDYNSQIKTVVVSEGVTSIGNTSFSLCTNLVEVDIASSVSTLGDGVFSGCSSLTTVTLPANMTSIGSYAFSSCSALQTISIPSGLTEINPHTFGMSGLVEVTIPEGVTTLGTSAFYECEALSSISLPSSITSIGECAFMSCFALSEATYAGNATQWSTVSIGSENTPLTNVIQYSTEPTPVPTAAATETPAPTTEPTPAPTATPDVEESASPTDTTTPTPVPTATPEPTATPDVEESASPTDTTTPTPVPTATPEPTATATPDAEIVASGTCGDNLTWTLDDTGLLTISGTGDMEDWLYYTDVPPWDTYCSKITKVVVSEGITSIGKYAFYRCKALRSIVIPESIEHIGSAAFTGCDYLSKVIYPGTGDQWSDISIGGNNYNLYRGTEFALQGTCGNNLTWTLEGTRLTISGTGNMDDWEYSSRAPWYAYYLRIKDVSISDGVASIGKYAFYGFSKLTDIVLPDSVTSIGSSAFTNCYALTSITIPEGVTSIGDLAFYYCTTLTSITIPESLASIGNNAFSNCSTLTSVSYPGSAEQWYSISFGTGNDTLINAAGFELPTSGSCGDSLTWTLVDGTLTISGSGAMTNWTASQLPLWYFSRDDITSIVLNDSVTTIGDYAFYGCSAFTTFTIPLSTTTIGSHAFYNCSALTEIVCTEEQWKSLKIADGNAPLYNASIFTFGCCGENLTWTLVDNILTISGTGDMDDFTSSAEVPWSKYTDSIESVVIEDGVTSIGVCAFSECTSITSVTIPDSVTSMGNRAFSHCSALTTVTIPGSVEAIPNGAFSSCSALTKVVINEGPASIGNAAFHSCTSLTSISIPGTVKTIGSSAFYNCSSLKTIVIPEGVETLGVMDWQGGPETEAGVFAECSALTKITLPVSLKTIGVACFCDTSKLSTVVYNGTAEDWKKIQICHMNSYLLSAADYPAAGYCGENLTWSISGSTLTISGTGDMADFSTSVNPWRNYETTVKKIVIKEGVTSISNSAFVYLRYATSTTIPLSVVSVGEGAYGGDMIEGSGEGAPLTSVSYAGTMEDWMAIDIGDSNYYLWNAMGIGFGTCGTNVSWFYYDGTLIISGTGAMKDYDSEISSPWQKYAPSITEIIVEEGVTHIGAWAFDGDYLKESDADATYHNYVKTVSLPSTLKSIGNGAFQECRRLTGIIIPEGVTTIGSNAFSMCTSMTTVTIPVSMETIGWGAFSTCTSLVTANYYGIYDQWAAIDIDDCNTDLTDVCTLRPPKYGTCGENLSWNLDDYGVLTITGTGDMTNYEKKGTPWYSHRALIKSVILDEGIASIGTNAFYGCNAIVSLDLPASLTGLDPYAFEGCTALETITISDNSSFRVVDNVLYSIDMTTLVLYPAAKPDVGYIIPNSVTALTEAAFYECVYLRDIIIPVSLANVNRGILVCPKLTYIRYTGTEDQWASLDTSYFDTEVTCGAGWARCGDNWYWVTEEGTFLCSDWAHDGAGWCWFDDDGKMVTSQWVDDSYYCGEDGYRVTGWQKISGSWYYFDADGLKLTGWQTIDGSTYYLGTDGVMVTGWQDIDGSRYRFNSSGVMQTGWISLSGNWYYLDPTTGAMQTGWLEISSKTYYMDESGVMQTGWTEIDGEYYYLDDTLQYGWLQSGGSWYYLHPETGAMLTGWQDINSKRYYLGEDGAMQTGWVNVDGNYYYLDDYMQTGWVKSGSTWYYLDETGIMQTGWAEIDGALYYFNPSGSLKTGWFEADRMDDGETEWYYLTSNGAKTGWYKSGSSWYYFDPSTSIMQTGWAEIDGKLYYFNPSGALTTGWFEADRMGDGETEWYYLTSNGAKTGWYQSGSWYYFDPSTSIMQTGWAEIDGKLYYFNTSGSLKTGWFETDRMGDGQTEWYYLTSSGAKTSVWYKSGGYWYWFKEDSVMAVSETLDIDGVSYTFNSSGHWIS